MYDSKDILQAPNFRSLRVSSVLKRALSEFFLRELYDLSCVVTVSSIKVSDDIRNATVFVTVREGEVNKDDIIKALNEASETIRRRSMFKSLKLKSAPRLYFKLDDELDHFFRISEVMSSLE